ncbi:MAG TPA: hypothetical protein VF941_21730 [Clostridia bacterium]
MKSKRIQLIEGLIKNMNTMKVERYNLDVRLKMLQELKDNAIEGEFLKASGTNFTGIKMEGYKEQRLLVPKDIELSMLQDEESFVLKRIKYLEQIISIIENSLNSLLPEDRQIIIDFYVKGNSLLQIASAVHMAPESICRKKRHILEYLGKVISEIPV